MKKITLLLSFFAVLRGWSPLLGQGHPALSISHLTGPLYIYTTYGLAGGVPFPANGLYLVTDQGAVLIDAPWDTTQVQPLLDSIEQKHHQKVVLSLSTHFHDDRTAGIPSLRAKGVKSKKYGRERSG